MSKTLHWFGWQTTPHDRLNSQTRDSVTSGPKGIVLATERDQQQNALMRPVCVKYVCELASSHLDSDRKQERDKRLGHRKTEV